MADDADDSQNRSETPPSASEDKHREHRGSRTEAQGDGDRQRFDDFAMI
jgi:hypothetical protein